MHNNIGHSRLWLVLQLILNTEYKTRTQILEYRSTWNRMDFMMQNPDDSKAQPAINSVYTVQDI